MKYFFFLILFLHTVSSKNLLVELGDKISSSSSTELGSELESETSSEEVEKKVERKVEVKVTQMGAFGGNDYMSVKEARALGCKGLKNIKACQGKSDGHKCERHGDSTCCKGCCRRVKGRKNTCRQNSNPPNQTTKPFPPIFS